MSEDHFYLKSNFPKQNMESLFFVLSMLIKLAWPNTMILSFFLDWLIDWLNGNVFSLVIAWC